MRGWEASRLLICTQSERGMIMENDVNVVAEYDYYTLDQARKILAVERAYKRACVKERRRAYKERKKYFMKQKVVGLSMVLASAFLIVVGCIPAAIFVPGGLTLMFTRHMWLVNDYYRDVMERGNTHD